MSGVKAGSKIIIDPGLEWLNEEKDLRKTVES